MNEAHGICDLVHVKKFERVLLLPVSTSINCSKSRMVWPRETPSMNAIDRVADHRRAMAHDGAHVKELTGIPIMLQCSSFGHG